MNSLKTEYENRLEQHKKNRVFSGLSLEVIHEEYFLKGLKYALDRIESANQATQTEKSE